MQTENGVIGPMSKTYEQFKEECKAPVDIEACREALSKILKGEHRMCVPVNIDDDDMLIARALDELESLRSPKECTEGGSANETRL